jgi:hypothetical protein
MTEAIPTKNRTACRLVRCTQPGSNLYRLPIRTAARFWPAPLRCRQWHCRVWPLSPIRSSTQSKRAPKLGPISKRPSRQPASCKRPFQKSSGNPTSLPGKARLSVPMTPDGSQQNAQVVISEAFVLICWTLDNDATLTAITHSGPPRLRDGLRCGVRSKQLS